MFTHIDHGFQFEELEAVTTDSDRTYSVPVGNGEYVKYPSVTTVIGFDQKDFFTEWRAMPGNKLKSEIACERGNVIHNAAEDYLNNVEGTIENIKNNDYRSMIKTMKKALDKIDNIRELEVPMYSHTLEIAGRSDCVGEYNGKLSIIDFKGSNRVKKEEHIENYFIQATIYSIMWEEMTGQRIDNLVIIMGNEDGYCQVFEKNTADYVPLVFRKLLKYSQFVEKGVC